MVKRNIKTKLQKILKKYNQKKYKKGEFTEYDVLFDIKLTTGNFRNEEDKQFYFDQKGERVATIGSVAIADDKKIHANEERYKRNHTPKDTVSHNSHKR